MTTPRPGIPVIDIHGVRHTAPPDTPLTNRVTTHCGRTILLGALATPPTRRCPDCATTPTHPGNPDPTRRRLRDTLRRALRRADHHG